MAYIQIVRLLAFVSANLPFSLHSSYMLVPNRLQRCIGIIASLDRLLTTIVKRLLSENHLKIIDPNG